MADVNQSAFIEVLNKFLPSLGNLIEKINGSKKPLTYLWKDMLRKEYSADQNWSTGTVNTIFVEADIVAVDSPLPEKSRPSIASFSGKLPKIGTKRTMKESDLNTVRYLQARGGNNARIAQKLMEDPIAVATSIDEKIEATFLKGLSNGYVLIEDSDNEGTAIRANFGYLDENKFGVKKAGVIDYESIQNVLSIANSKGDSITHIALSLATYNAMRQQDWAKQLVANYKGQVVASSAALPVPTASVFDEAFADDNNGIQFIKVDRTIYKERNGQRTPYKPWNDNNLIFLTTTEVGAFVWGDLAEKDYPVQGVTYSVVDEYKLISRYSKSDPALCEITKGQALALPVIEDSSSIYVLDKSEGSTQEQTEGDNKFAYNGKNLNKTELIASLNANGVTVASDITDQELEAVMNGLSVARKREVLKGVNEVA